MYEIQRASEGCKPAKPISLTEPIPAHLKFEAPLRAELYGSNTATISAGTATDITTISTTPVLALCRQLLAAGLDPDAALHVYRQGVLALHIKSIGRAAQLTVEDDRLGKPILRRWRDRSAGAAPPIRKNGGGL